MHCTAWRTNCTYIRSFVGLRNVFRRCVLKFATIATRLNRKLEYGKPAKFGYLTDAEHEVFTTLKAASLSPPLFALPKEGLPFTVNTEASDAQDGSCLMLEQGNGDVLPVCYWIRALTKTEENYTTTEKECLPVVCRILMLRLYLYGARFTLTTDHDSLGWIRGLVCALEGPWLYKT